MADELTVIFFEAVRLMAPAEAVVIFCVTETVCPFTSKLPLPILVGLVWKFMLSSDPPFTARSASKPALTPSIFTTSAPEPPSTSVLIVNEVFGLLKSTDSPSVETI